MFSGDGARVLFELFPPKHIKIAYAEHFTMPNNICNFMFGKRTTEKKLKKLMRQADKLMESVCFDIKNGFVKKRGFAFFSQLFGKLQGRPWQGDPSNPHAAPKTIEYKAKHGVKVSNNCTVCYACINCCPMKNLTTQNGRIVHKNNCTICYRCVNLCPSKAITTFMHAKPKWQYKPNFEVRNEPCK